MSHRPGADVVLAFTIGGAIGVAAGLLLAPAPGAETRRRLSELGARTGARSRKAVEAGCRVAADQARRLGRAFEEGRDTFAREAASTRIRTALKKEGIEGGGET